MATSQAIAAARTAIGATSNADAPMRSETSRTAVKGTLSTAVVPAAIPAATAGVVSSPGRTSAATIAAATPIAIAGNTGPPRNPAPSDSA